jgi:exosortase/archaeosortase family protein
LKGVKDFVLPIALIAAAGFLSMVNLLSPLFPPFQIIVPVTASLAQGVLNLMGYHTIIYPGKEYAPTMLVSNASGFWGAKIVWPCAGIDSLIIYTVVILLFLHKAYIPRWQKIAYFIVGAVVTYFINVLRIATLFIIGVNKGDVWGFHDYWAQFYSTIWIISYMLLIIGSRILWGRIRRRNSKEPVLKDGKSSEGPINPVEKPVENPL